MPYPSRDFRIRLHEQVEDWYDVISVKGHCVGVQDKRFFSEDVVEANRMIKVYCKDCPVQIECLYYAITTKQHYVWGGTTEDTRSYILHEERESYGPTADDPFIFPSDDTFIPVLTRAREFIAELNLPVRRVGRPSKEKKTKPNPLVQVD